MKATQTKLAENISTLCGGELKEKIFNLQHESEKLPQVDIPIKHYHANGFYAREMLMPKGCTIVGKIHKSEHICIISKGCVDIVSEEKTERVKAPFTYISQPGAKRAIYSHEETVWTTIHMTTETNIEKLEDVLIAESFSQLESDKTFKIGGVS